jgi:hypothetical protein
MGGAPVAAAATNGDIAVAGAMIDETTAASAATGPMKKPETLTASVAARERHHRSRIEAGAEIAMLTRCLDGAAAPSLHLREVDVTAVTSAFQSLALGGMRERT